MLIINGGVQLSGSDLVGHLNCHHLTTLERAAATGQMKRPYFDDPVLKALWERGVDHEKAYIEHLRTAGYEVHEIAGVGVTRELADATFEAMRRGVPIISQGAFLDGRWSGRTDILRRLEIPSALGGWSYEVIDTKLAMETKGGTILQLCLYSDLVGQRQGLSPEKMYVVTPWSDYEAQEYRVVDYAAYYRWVKASLEQKVTAQTQGGTYPDPKAHCDICAWRVPCDLRRRQDDHLCLVAGISKTQISELHSHGVTTTELLAEVPLPLQWKPERGSRQSFEKVREQARIQVEGRRESRHVYEALPPLVGFGLHCLPEPSRGDIFLDLEGDPFVGEGGLEYLFGYIYTAADGNVSYVGDWATSREQEKNAFERFVDFVMARLSEYPNLHIFHYAAYEPGALKRLMGRYATREEEIDQMLRAGLFVDLYTVTRHSVRASVESYSIKKLEPFYGFARKVDLHQAGAASAQIQARLELNDAGRIQEEAKQLVGGYNQDDCLSTMALRAWLEEIRTDLIANGANIQRPEPGEGTASENVSEWLQRIGAVISRLTEDVPVDEAERSADQQARWILANILDWHRRENKAAWWEYFRLSGLMDEELLDEKSGLAGLEYLDVAGGTARAPIHRYRFAVQDTEIRGGEDLHYTGGQKYGKVESINLDEQTVNVKKRADTAAVHAEAVFSHLVVNTDELAESLLRVGQYVAEHGLSGDGPYQAARDLLLRKAPQIAGRGIRAAGESPLESALSVSVVMEGGVLPIQGPPGAGKTYTGSEMICALVKQGKRVGITANSHKVIRHLIDEAIEAATRQNLSLRCIQKAKEIEEATDALRFAKDNGEVFAALRAGCQVAGGTAWLWAREEAFESVDFLFVDEAAQMSLANVIAASNAAKSVVLLGDPQQLEQPIQGSHPDGTDISALNHILHGHQTIQEDKGLFLEETWRLHPDICAFTSELFYESRLRSRDGLERQQINSTGRVRGNGLRFLPVVHQGNQNSSPEEADAVHALVTDILSSGSTWVNPNGEEKALTLNDILIIAPYNAHVFEIKRKLAEARVGTVDKFQGQEAPIAIYSMATSSYADAPRGMEFLYSLNRLNVATSRARCISVVVASPSLLEPDCRTPHQMTLANAFCRYLEMAERL